MLEARLAALEGAEACRATATGMAAVHAALLSHPGGGPGGGLASAVRPCHWIVSTLLPRYGIESVFVDGPDLAQWKQALSRPTALVLLETPSNPACLEIVDLKAVCGLAHRAGAIVVVDNVCHPAAAAPARLRGRMWWCIPPPAFRRPGPGAAGAVLGRRTWVEERRSPFLRNTGTLAQPFQRLGVIPARGWRRRTCALPAMCRSAAAIADMLAERAEVARVLYPSAPTIRNRRWRRSRCRPAVALSPSR